MRLSGVAEQGDTMLYGKSQSNNINYLKEMNYEGENYFK
jgi:hypothetical protein